MPATLARRTPRSGRPGLRQPLQARDDCRACASNWLPAPDGPFDLTTRSYSPLAPVLTGSYRLPAVKRVGAG